MPKTKPKTTTKTKKKIEKIVVNKQELAGKGERIRRG